MSTRGAALAALAAALLAAGCGGGGDDAKADFVRQADAICRAGDAEVAELDAAIAAAQRGSDRTAVFAELARLTRRSVAVSSRAVDRLDALDKPAGDREALQGWIADARRQVALVGRLSTALAREDETAVATLSEQIDTLATRNNAFARRYGMADCARSR